MRQGCTFKTRQCLNRRQAERRSSPALDVDYQLWGTGGGYSLLQSTLLVPSGEPQGQHQGPSTALLPPLPPAEFTKHLPQLQAMGYLPSASSRRLRSKQSGHELMRPCPQRDVRYVSPASPTCVCALGDMAWHARASWHELIPMQYMWILHV